MVTFLAELKTNLSSQIVNLGQELRFLAFVHSSYLRDQFDDLEKNKGNCMVFFLAWQVKKSKVLLMALRSDPWSEQKVLILHTIQTAEIKLPP